MGKVICTAYGDSVDNKGIAIIDEDLRNIEYLLLPGKCNFCIERNNILYAPVQAEENVIMEFEKKDGSYLYKGTYPVSHFYSHGVFFEEKLILASFSNGVDAIYDVVTHKELDVCVHSRKGYETNGRSHYVGVTPDQRHIYSVDNGLQQIYLYRIMNDRFVIDDVREFSEENIRLMPYSQYSNCAYLNTEKTNRIYVMEYEEGKYHIKDIEKMESGEKCFSGGNSISEDGQRLCVSLRGDNILNYYQINKDGSLYLLSRVSCGDMPRDVLLKGDRAYVSCTNDNTIEVYDTKKDRLIKINEISVAQPITFACA